MKKFPIALQLYSVRDNLARDFEGTLRQVAQMGYDGVEFAGLYGKSGEEVKRITDELGLKVISAHVPLAEMVADPEGVFALYKSLGCAYVAVPYLPESGRPVVGDFEKTVKTVTELALKAKALIVEPRDRIARVIEAEAVVLTLDEAAVYRQIRGIVAIDAVGIVR